MRRALAERPTTDALWSAALLDLWSTRPDGRTIDRVIGRLSEVLSRDSTNAEALNDLAIAHAMRASDRDDARDLFTALDYVERAYARDTASWVIRFNRALLLDRSHLTELASQMWELAARDPNAAWAAEARARLERLRAPSGPGRVRVVDFEGPSVTNDSISSLVRRDPQTAREYVMDSLTLRWSRAVLQGDTAAASLAVRRSAAVGRILGGLSGDSSVAQMSSELARAIGDDATPVATAVSGASKGISLFRRASTSEAGVFLRSAANDLRRRGFTALADWADLGLAGVELQRADYRAAERIFSAVSARAGARRAWAVEARARWGMALSQGRRGAASETETSYSIAVDRFSRLGETSNAGFMHALIADIHHALGRPAEYARAMYAALDAFRRRPDPSLGWAVLAAHSQRLGDRGLHYAAAVTIREAIAVAPSTGRPKDIPESLARLALQQVRLHDEHGATLSLTAARQALTRIADRATYERIDVEIARAEAVAYRTIDPRRALDRLDHIARYFERVNIPVDLAPTLIARADVSLALGDSARALRDLDLAIDATTTLLPRQADRDLVRRVRETQADVFRRLVAISIARHDTAGAYRYAELSRDDSITSPRSSAGPRGSTARDHATIAYLAADDRLHLFIVKSNGNVVLTTAAVPTHELTPLARRFVNLVREDADSRVEDEVGRRLFEVLIQPALGLLSGVSRLSLVTDRVIADVPFGALRDSAGRYLIARFTLTHARRVSGGATLGAAPPIPPNDILLVGDPTWDPTLFPDLEPLRAADGEVESIRPLYSRATVLHGIAATRGRVMEALPSHRIVHFAGHARVALDEPPASHLVLARDTTGFAGNVLFASDLARMKLRGVHLAILSACGASGSPYAQPALNGLVQALLDAGVGRVIASQWEADDESTAELMRAFHSELRRGMDPAEALQRAQLTYARDTTRPTRQWSTFRLSID